jgi:hypothetical protein
MGYVAGFAALVGILALLRWAANAPPAQVAKALRFTLPGALGLAGAALTFAGRAGAGSMLIVLAMALFGRVRGVQGGSTKGAGARSTVRSDRLEMELDHDTGDMDGIVRDGPYDGMPLSMMNAEQHESLWRSFEDDAESRALLETYLDRKAPGWRERLDSRGGGGQRGAPGAGAMTEQEAYDVLGLEPGADEAAIRKAHRRLMQRVHPDLGGTDFLAARINAAKDFLLSTHRKS